MNLYKCGYRKEHEGYTDKTIKGPDIEVEAHNRQTAYQKFIDSSEQIGNEQLIVRVHCSGWDASLYNPPHITTKERDKIKIEEEEKEFKKETEKYSNMTKDELLLKMIQIQNKQINLFENQIKKQNEQTEALYKIRWAIIALLIFIVGQTIVLKMKLGL
jgi:hypothetical protein